MAHHAIPMVQAFSHQASPAQSHVHQGPTPSQQDGIHMPSDALQSRPSASQEPTSSPSTLRTSVSPPVSFVELDNAMHPKEALASSSSPPALPCPSISTSDVLSNVLKDLSEHSDRHHALLSNFQIPFQDHVLVLLDDLSTHLLRPAHLHRLLSSLLDTAAPPDARHLRDSAEIFKSAFDAWCAQVADAQDRILVNKAWLEDLFKRLEDNAVKAQNLTASTRDAATKVHGAHTSTIQRYEATENDLRADLAKLEQKFEDGKELSARFERLAVVECGRVDQLEKANARLEADLDAERSSKAELTAENERLQADLLTLSTYILQLQDSKQSLQTALDAEHSSKVQLVDTNAHLQNDLDAQHSHTTSLEQTIANLEADLEAEKQRHVHDVQALEELLAVERQKTAGLTEQLATAKNNLRNQGCFMTERIDTLKREAKMREQVWKDKWTVEAQERVKASKKLAWLEKQQDALHRRNPASSSSQSGPLASRLSDAQDAQDAGYTPSDTNLLDRIAMAFAAMDDRDPSPQQLATPPPSAPQSAPTDEPSVDHGSDTVETNILASPDILPHDPGRPSISSPEPSSFASTAGLGDEDVFVDVGPSSPRDTIHPSTPPSPVQQRTDDGPSFEVQSTAPCTIITAQVDPSPPIQVRTSSSQVESPPVEIEPSPIQVEPSPTQVQASLPTRARPLASPLSPSPAGPSRTQPYPTPPSTSARGASFNYTSPERDNDDTLPMILPLKRKLASVSTPARLRRPFVRTEWSPSKAMFEEVEEVERPLGANPFASLLSTPPPTPASLSYQPAIIRPKLEGGEEDGGKHVHDAGGSLYGEDEEDEEGHSPHKRKWRIVSRGEEEDEESIFEGRTNVRGKRPKRVHRAVSAQEEAEVEDLADLTSDDASVASIVILEPEGHDDGDRSYVDHGSTTNSDSDSSSEDSAVSSSTIVTPSDTEDDSDEGYRRRPARKRQMLGNHWVAEMGARYRISSR